MDHPFAAPFKLSKLRCFGRPTRVHRFENSYWQVTTPATVAGATAEAFPIKSAQKCG
jgi:hypothetical protein